MNISVAVIFVLIVLARITDVTLDTIPTASIAQGLRTFRQFSGFSKILFTSAPWHKFSRTWTITSVRSPTDSAAHSEPFRGITIEHNVAFRNQLSSLFAGKGLG